MPLELTMLAYSVVLTFGLIMIPAAVALMELGPVWGAGNRETAPEGNAFYERALRARNNMLEAMALFAPLVLIASITDTSIAETALGAQIFFYARLAHALFYLAGWPWVRTAAWLGGVIGTAIIFLALLA